MSDNEDLYMDLVDYVDSQCTAISSCDDSSPEIEITLVHSISNNDDKTDDTYFQDNAKKNALGHFLSTNQSSYLGKEIGNNIFQQCVAPSRLLQVSIPKQVQFRDSSLQFMNMKVSQETIDSFSSIANNALVKMSISNLTSNFSTHMFLKPLKFEVPTVTDLDTFKFNAVIDYSNSVGSEDLVLRDMTVARFGRVYKRKAPSKMGYQCVSQIEGYRYCKFCNANLPLAAFYVTQKRYVCRRHHYLRVVLRTKEVAQSNVYFRLAKQAWIKLDNAKFLLGYDKLRYDIGDIQQIFTHLSKVIPIEKMEPLCVPRDYSLPMRPANVAVISSSAFYLALKFLDFMPCRPFYVAFVQRANLVPKNFDVGNPEKPFHDPSYIRKEYNLGTLFAEFEALNLPIEHKDNDVIQELMEKDKVPWRDCEELPPGEAGSWQDGKPVGMGNVKRKRARIEPVVDSDDME